MNVPRETKVGSGGFVRYVDHLGSDESIVSTARVSTGRGFVSWDPYKRCKWCNLVAFADGMISKAHMINPKADCASSINDNHEFESFPRGDVGIINYMMENHHTSPFEFGEIVFHLRIPMHIWRQVVRHRTANVQEYSTRYSEAIDEFETTTPDEWRTQGQQNRQGSDECLPRGTSDSRQGYYLSSREREVHAYCREVYEERLRLGVAREQARKDLPLSNYTEVYWKLDLHNLFNFLSLRLERHAQLETRQFAAGIGTIVKELFPHCYTAFEEFKLHAISMSRTEWGWLQDMFRDVAKDFYLKLKLDPATSKSRFEKFLKKVKPS